MCYSAQVQADYLAYIKYGGSISLKDFAQLYTERETDSKLKIPKAIDAWFADPKSDEEHQIKAMIDAHNKTQIAKWEPELFKQRRRLADAQRALQTKPTKKAESDQRIAINKVDQLLGWIADATRTDLRAKDARIYPQHYAPVMIWEDGKCVIKPMRYLLRPADKPASIDHLGTLYNARRDNLEKFWGSLFGYTHGIALVQRFYENVERFDSDGKPYNAVLEFAPATGQDMLVACLWSKWTGPGQRDLLSFAAITDEPPAEVAAAGHDRCIIPIKPEHIDAWLNPAGDRARAYAILDDRERPYYEHQQLAA